MMRLGSNLRNNGKKKKTDEAHPRPLDGFYLHADVHDQ